MLQQKERGIDCVTRKGSLERGNPGSDMLRRNVVFAPIWGRLFLLDA
jgi:hypothetical protein